MRRGLVIIATLVGLLGLATAPGLAGGGGHGAQACAGFAEGGQVTLRDTCLDGTAHFLPDDADLRVRNDGQTPHNYVALDGSFETATLSRGEEEIIERPDPGVYRVYCSLHASVDGHGMAGVLVVGDPGALGVAPAVAAEHDAAAAAATSETVVGGLWAGIAAVLALALITMLVMWARGRRRLAHVASTQESPA